MLDIIKSLFSKDRILFLIDFYCRYTILMIAILFIGIILTIYYEYYKQNKK